MIGPDFSTIDSLLKAEDLCRQGTLEPLLLLPEAFGGRAVPENVVYVPLGIAQEKARIDHEIVAPLVKEGRIRRYQAVPEYQGKSFVPIALKITAWDPASFSGEIIIWGDALARSQQSS